MARLPAAVPVSEVENYTDMVDFSEFHFPVGFERQDEILINLRGIRRVQHAAGLGVIRIETNPWGQAGSYEPQVSSLDRSGVATFSGVGKRHKNRLNDNTVSYNTSPKDSSYYGRPLVTILINRGESEERIKEAGAHADVFQPAPQARMLDKAIRDGLLDASVYANIDGAKVTTALASTLVFGAFWVTGFYDSVPQTIAAISLSNELGNPVRSYMRKKESGRSMFGHDFRHFRRSLFPGVAVDRMILGTLAAYTSRFARASIVNQPAT